MDYSVAGTTVYENLHDADADGVVEVHEFTYDGIGNRLTARNDLDDGIDGQLDAWATESFEYGTGGEWLGSRFDFHAPSNPEPGFGSTTAVTQTPFTDGVLLLASEYLDWGLAGAAQ